MAWQVVEHVVEHSQHSGTRLNMLIMISRYANAKTGVCWPSMTTLAKDCRVRERRARGLVSELVKSGELAKTNRRGRSAILQVVGYVNGNILPPENREAASSSQLDTEAASSSQLERQEVATTRQEIAATPTPVGREGADEPKNQQENQKTIEPKEENAPLAQPSPPAPAP